jgi:hypothetical protein
MMADEQLNWLFFLLKGKLQPIFYVKSAACLSWKMNFISS